MAPFDVAMTVEETVEHVRKLVDDIDPDAVVIDKKSAAHVLIDPLARAGVDVQSPDYASVQQSWTDFERYFAEGKVAHDDSQVWVDELTSSKLRFDTRNQVIGFDRYFNHPQALQAAVLAVWALNRFEVKVPTFKKITDDSPSQRILPRMIRAGVA